VGRGSGRALALGAACALLLVGCANNTTFTASEFVDKINSEGLQMELGPRLPTTADARELFVVKLPPLPREPGHGSSGTLYEYGDNGGAESRMGACHSSGGLLCYRVQNIVVVLENGGLEAARLSVAVRRLASSD
jgi:hypothetical protein